MEKFAIGILVGGLAGALLTANNYKMRTLVKKGQEEVMTKLDNFMDEKIDKMEDNVEKAKEAVAEKVEEFTEKKSRKSKKDE